VSQEDSGQLRALTAVHDSMLCLETRETEHGQHEACHCISAEDKEKRSASNKGNCNFFRDSNFPSLEGGTFPQGLHRPDA
jgi:hypothetical protein